MRLKDVTSQITDGVHATPNYVDNGIPFLSVNNLSKDRLDFTVCKYILLETHRELIKRCNPSKGDVLMGKVATLGVSAVVDTDIEFSIFVQIALLRPNSLIDSYFLKYMTELPGFRHYINSVAAGTSMKYIGIGDIARLQIPVPPILEQKEIVEILATWDEAIATTEKLIAAKQKLKKNIYQKILPNYPKAKKAGWSWQNLRDIAFINSSSLSENTALDREFYYIDLSSVKQGEIDIPLEKIKFSELPSRARRLATSGNVIMATVRPNLKGFAYVGISSNELVFSTGFAILEAKFGIDSRYLYHCLYSVGIECQIQARVTGSNYPAVNERDLATVLFPIPDDYTKQVAIANLFSALDSEIRLLYQTLLKLQIQKRGLMQKLLTGEWRVKIEETAAQLAETKA